MSVTIETVRRVALALPGVEEGVCYGTPAFYVRRKMVARLRDDHETLVVAFPKAARDALIARQPDVFSVTDHYQNYDNVLLNLLAADEELLRWMIDGAWRLKAAKTQVAAHDAKKATGEGWGAFGAGRRGRSKR